MEVLPHPGLKLALKGNRYAGAMCPPVHSDHLGIEDVPEDLFHRDLSSVAGAPAQSVGEVVPRAQGQDGHPGDELVLALSEGGEGTEQIHVFYRHGEEPGDRMVREAHPPLAS